MKIKIGLEIHVTINTQSKLFCSCSTKQSSPNTQVCPVCLGHPGSKPVTNKEAVKKIILIAKALNCELREELIFSRKSYFYPDLSKNYQITQFEEPIGENGFFESKGKIRIKRVHLEEDPASITRTNKTLIDYNRSGTPLAEIVTEPDITSSLQARAFMKKLLRDLQYLEVFNGEDVIKADVNVSVEKSGFKRVEVKNVTGFKDIQSVIEHEVRRQQKEEVVENETRGWDAAKRKTYSMRKKETEADYAYIYEPDIPIIDVSKFLGVKLPKLSDERIKDFIEKGVDPVDADIICMRKDVADFFEKTTSEPKITSYWVRRELLRVLEDNAVEETFLDAKEFSKLIELVEKKTLNENIAKEILELMRDKKIDVKKYVEKNNLKTLNDDNLIEETVKRVLKENQKAVEDYKSGEEKALQYLVGQVMKLTKGKAHPKKTNEMILERIE